MAKPQRYWQCARLFHYLGAVLSSVLGGSEASIWAGEFDNRSSADAAAILNQICVWTLEWLPYVPLSKPNALFVRARQASDTSQMTL